MSPSKKLLKEFNRKLGSDKAELFYSETGVAGLEALESFMMSIDSQQPKFIEWVFNGILTGPLGEGLDSIGHEKVFHHAFLLTAKEHPLQLLTLIKVQHNKSLNYPIATYIEAAKKWLGADSIFELIVESPFHAHKPVLEALFYAPEVQPVVDQCIHIFETMIQTYPPQDQAIIFEQEIAIAKAEANTFKGQPRNAEFYHLFADLLPIAFQKSELYQATKGIILESSPKRHAL